MKKTINKVVKWKESLFFSLFVWFILNSIIPLSIFAGYSYLVSIEKLENSAKLQLENSSGDQIKFIDNWFNYRFRDMSYWSSMQNNIDFLRDLQDKYREAENMTDFLESYSYATIVDKYSNDLKTLQNKYEYIHDFFLIGMDGNILYTSSKESDLGTNLLNGPYSSTKFAQTFKKTLLSGEIYFSDLELYAPSNNQVAGFFTAPLMDGNGNIKGVFAIQIKPEYVYRLLTEDLKGIVHYLVGSDSILRSDFSSDKKALVFEANNEQINFWKQEHIENSPTKHSNKFSNYYNIENTMVVGVHKDIDIRGVHWALVSESSYETVFSDKEKIFKTLLLYLMGIILFIIGAAVYVSRKITRPICNLASASREFSQGKPDLSIVGHSRGEVEELAKAFNEMMVSIKNKENAIMEQKEELESVLDQLDKNVIISKTDLAGRITYVSQAFTELSGYARAELVGELHSIVRHPDMNSGVFEDLWATLKKEGCWYGELKDMKKNGSSFWLYQRIEPEYDKNGKVVAYRAIGHNITELKDCEINLQQSLDIKTMEIKKQTEILFQQSRMAQMGEMISMIAHQWRQPLAAISSTSIDLSMQIEFEKFDLEDEQGREACQTYLTNGLREIDGFVQSLTNTIDDFRNFYKPNKELDFVFINEPITKALKVIKSSLLHDGIEVVETYPHNFAKLQIYNNEFMQVILNILKNSQDNFKEKAIKDPKITIKYQEKNDKIILEISDNGGGIPEYILPKIFDPYFSTKGEKNGTGLGLYMSKIIVEEHHNGSLVAKNIDGGVSFRILLNKEI